jgi:hypothetical protein
VPKVRRALLVLLVIFVIYAVVKDPTQSASVTSNLWDALKNGIESVFTFFDALLSS